MWVGEINYFWNASANLLLYQIQNVFFPALTYHLLYQLCYHCFMFNHNHNLASLWNECVLHCPLWCRWSMRASERRRGGGRGPLFTLSSSTPPSPLNDQGSENAGQFEWADNQVCSLHLVSISSKQIAVGRYYWTNICKTSNPTCITADATGLFPLFFISF